MNKIVQHIRNQIVSGALAAVPVIIVVVLALEVEERLAPLQHALGIRFPGVGVLLVLTVLYITGLFVSSYVGHVFIGVANRAISRIPGLNAIYTAWKDVLVASTPEEANLFQQVVLVPSEGKNNWEIAFTNGRPLPGDSNARCVFVPDAINPFGGRLVIADQKSLVQLDTRPAEAFKFLVSRGKYLPSDLTRAPGLSNRPSGTQPT